MKNSISSLCHVILRKNNVIFKKSKMVQSSKNYLFEIMMAFFNAMMPDSFGVPTMSPLCVPTSPNPFTCSETALATQRRVCQGTHQKRTDTSSCPHGVGDMLMLAGHLKQENFPRT